MRYSVCLLDATCNHCWKKSLVAIASFISAAGNTCSLYEPYHKELWFSRLSITKLFQSSIISAASVNKIHRAPVPALRIAVNPNWYKGLLLTHLMFTIRTNYVKSAQQQWELIGQPTNSPVIITLINITTSPMEWVWRAPFQYRWNYAVVTCQTWVDYNWWFICITKIIK